MEKDTPSNVTTNGRGDNNKNTDTPIIPDNEQLQRLLKGRYWCHLQDSVITYMKQNKLNNC